MPEQAVIRASQGWARPAGGQPCARDLLQQQRPLHAGGCPQLPSDGQDGEAAHFPSDALASGREQKSYVCLCVCASVDDN